MIVSEPEPSRQDLRGDKLQERPISWSAASHPKGGVTFRPVVGRLRNSGGSSVAVGTILTDREPSTCPPEIGTGKMLDFGLRRRGCSTRVNNLMRII